MQEFSISNYFLRAVVKKAQQQGYDPLTLLRRAKIPASLFNEPSARITVEQYTLLQKITIREMKDEVMGYFEKPLKIGTWSAICHWLVKSRTLSQALKRFAHFHDLMEKALNTTLRSETNTVTINFEPWQKASIEPYGYELFIFSFHRLICWLVKEKIPIIEIHLPYPEPEHSHEYKIMFPRAKIFFSSQQCQLIFNNNILKMPINHDHESFSAFMKEPLVTMLISDYNQKNWTEKAKAILRENLPTLPNLPEVAHALAIHPKKLRRLLNEEDITYSELKSQLRRDIAINNLTNTKKSIEEIAYLVGFSETSTFTRGFKHWTGVTPYSYRKLKHHTSK